MSAPLLRLCAHDPPVTAPTRGGIQSDRRENMIEIARKIRNQLAANPNRKTFRKTRATLLEIAVAIECAHAALNENQKGADQ